MQKGSEVEEKAAVNAPHRSSSLAVSCLAHFELGNISYHVLRPPALSLASLRTGDIDASEHRAVSQLEK